MVLSTVVGFHKPIIPFRDAVPKIGAGVPAQNGGKAAKVGIVGGRTVTVKVCVVAQSPAFGVKI